MQDKPLPSVTQVEEDVLGAILLDSDAVHVAIKMLTDECFYSTKNRAVFQVIKDLANKGIGIDILTVFTAITEKGITITAYEVSQLTSRIFTSSHITDWCDTLVRYAYRRRAWQHGIELANMALSLDTEISEIEVKIGETLNRSVDDIATSQDAMFEVLNEYDNLAQTRNLEAFGVRPLLAGMRSLVQVWRPSDLVIIAGRPGMGKTAMTKSLVYDFVAAGKKVVLYSLEMSKKQIAARFVHELVNMDKEQIARTILATDMAGYANTLQADISTAWGKRFKPNGDELLFINDGAGLTVERLRAEVALLKAVHPDLSAVIVDYLQIMTPSEKRNYNREQEISHISRSLKAIAREFDLTVFALSQLSRQCETRADKTPQLSDLRDSGAIEQDANMVLFLYRPEYYKETEVECEGEIHAAKGALKIVNAKYRDGQTGEKLFTFVPNITKIKDHDSHAAPAAGGNYLTENIPF